MESLVYVGVYLVWWGLVFLCASQIDRGSDPDFWEGLGVAATLGFLCLVLAQTVTLYLLGGWESVLGWPLARVVAALGLAMNAGEELLTRRA